MSIEGNAAVAREMIKILNLMDRSKVLPVNEQLAQIRKMLEQTKSAAETGWL